MSTETWYNGVITERWDDSTRTYTSWDLSGTQLTQRPYTPAENSAADAGMVQQQQQVNKSTIETNLEQDLATMQAIKDTDNAVIRNNPAPYIKDIATAVRRLIKMTLDDFSTAE